MPSRAYARLVWLTFAATMLAVIWGGIVRVSGSGLGCPDWPLCHGQFLPSVDLATRIEWTHRLLVLLAGILVAAVALWTLLRYRAVPLLAPLAVAAAILFALQAVIGGVVVILELPSTWVTAHLANAEILLAVLTVLAVLVRWPAVVTRARPDGAAWLGASALVATFALLLTGAYVRGADAATACTTWPLCDSGALPSDISQVVHMLHRYAAAAVGALIVITALAAWRQPARHPALRPLAALTLALFALQVALGAANPLTGFSPWALGAHPAVASLLWCSVVGLVAVQWRPLVPEGMAVARDVIALTKPAIMSLLLLTAFGGMFLAERGVPPFGVLLSVLIGGAFASGGAAALNQYFDRDIDELMRRTRKRPLPAHRVSTRVAVVLGLTLNVLAFAVLWLGTNLLAALLAVSGTLFYIFIYTLWLKRTTAQNIVIGGAAGAIPPLVGWAAVTGSLDLPAWLLFAIVFFWTPAHFWALALLIRDDYERAMVPMLPVVRGERATAWAILWYAASLIPLSLFLFVIRAAGMLYLVAALALGGLFVWYAVRLVRAADARRRTMARNAYVFSLLYLALLFVAIMVDSTVRLPL
ncbi:MAG: protoheme IX farnesyltransferase [Chloroflexi bacterium]|nr:protoheme IX farnesyltransferase [Chloroflexota bacterium]